MSEGELKTRLNIEKFEKFIAGLLINYGPDGHCDGYDVIAEKIRNKFFDVVDRAKNEFPYFKDYVDTPDDEEYFNTVKAWFIKHFGVVDG